MEERKLRELLEDLHGELENADSVEPETRHLLKSVLDEIPTSSSGPGSVLPRRGSRSPTGWARRCRSSRAAIRASRSPSSGS
jgi:hypothetical protein